MHKSLAVQGMNIYRLSGGQFVGGHGRQCSVRLRIKHCWEWAGRAGLPHLFHHRGPPSRAIKDRKTVNIGDVASDPSYLTALDSTRAKIIVPYLDDAGDLVIGTIDVESEHLNAFDATAQSLLEGCARMLANLCTNETQAIDR